MTLDPNVVQGDDETLVIPAGNMSQHQQCGLCGGWDSEQLTVDNGYPVYYCYRCQQRFQVQTDKRDFPYGSQQPKHDTGRGIGTIQPVLGR